MIWWSGQHVGDDGHAPTFSTIILKGVSMTGISCRWTLESPLTAVNWHVKWRTELLLLCALVYPPNIVWRDFWKHRGPVQRTEWLISSHFFSAAVVNNGFWLTFNLIEDTIPPHRSLIFQDIYFTLLLTLNFCDFIKPRF